MQKKCDVKEVLIASRKGGVGKSAISVNQARALRIKGYKRPYATVNISEDFSKNMTATANRPADAGYFK